MRRVKYSKHPEGYPYTLYQIFWEGKSSFVPAVSKETALLKIDVDESAKIAPANVTHLIKCIGHKGTSDLLSEINPRWITREGRIYYKNV